MQQQLVCAMLACPARQWTIGCPADLRRTTDHSRIDKGISHEFMSKVYLHAHTRAHRHTDAHTLHTDTRIHTNKTVHPRCVLTCESSWVPMCRLSSGGGTSTTTPLPSDLRQATDFCENLQNIARHTEHRRAAVGANAAARTRGGPGRQSRRPVCPALRCTRPASQRCTARLELSH